MNLTIDNVSKSYNKGKKQALVNFSTRLMPGVYGILGPNGAGKSTLMNIITDNLSADSGKVTFDGADIREMGSAYRDILGYMPQQQKIYDDFTGIRFMWYMAALKGLNKNIAKQRIDHLLQVVNMKQDSGKKMGSYSGGMKQRILIAQALLNDPKILILDEPTAGLDPKERIRIRNFISQIAMNKIVILATHVVTDVEFIAKEVILMKEGRLLLQDEPTAILNSMINKVYEVFVDPSELHIIQEQYKISNITSENGVVCAKIVCDEKPAEWRSEPVKANLEDVYLYLFDE